MCNVYCLLNKKSAFFSKKIFIFIVSCIILIRASYSKSSMVTWWSRVTCDSPAFDIRLIFGWPSGDLRATFGWPSGTEGYKLGCKGNTFFGEMQIFLGKCKYFWGKCKYFVGKMQGFFEENGFFNKKTSFIMEKHADGDEKMWVLVGEKCKYIWVRFFEECDVWSPIFRSYPRLHRSPRDPTSHWNLWFP